MSWLCIYSIFIRVSNRGCFTIFWAGGVLSVLSFWKMAHGCAIWTPLAKSAAVNLPLPAQLAGTARKSFWDFYLINISEVWSCWCREGYFGKAELQGCFSHLPSPQHRSIPLHLRGLQAASVGALPAWTSHCLAFPITAGICTACLHGEICTPGQKFQFPSASVRLNIGGARKFFHMCHDVFRFLPSGVGDRCELLLWVGEKPKVKLLPSSLCHPGVWTLTLR